MSSKAYRLQKRFKRVSKARGWINPKIVDIRIILFRQEEQKHKHRDLTQELAMI